MSLNILSIVIVIYLSYRDCEFVVLQDEEQDYRGF